uniref:Cornifelin n=1 Tax=Panthera tigris altaica TaxID=74533 RepID=A0A8C9JMF0_PANTA
MSYPVTSQPQCASSCYQTQLSDWHTGLTDCCNDMPLPLGPSTPCTLNFPCCGPSSLSKPYLPTSKPLPLGPRIPSGTLDLGSVGHDWAALTFCLPCALCQMARELKIRE